MLAYYLFLFLHLVNGALKTIEPLPQLALLVGLLWLTIRWGKLPAGTGAPGDE